VKRKGKGGPTVHTRAPQMAGGGKPTKKAHEQKEEQVNRSRMPFIQKKGGGPPWDNRGGARKLRFCAGDLTGGGLPKSGSQTIKEKQQSSMMGETDGGGAV